MIAAAMPSRLTGDTHEENSGLRHLIFRNVVADLPPLVMSGHMDTVFPPGESPEGVIRREGLFQGPGTADMKGGLTVMVFSLKILEELDLLAGIPLTVIFNGDEEIGSPGSEELIRRAAAGAAAGLVFECGGAEGEVVTARRGVRRFSLSLRGRSGHPGTSTGPKMSSVTEISRLTLRLEEGSDLPEGLSFNVGRIHGGTAANILADTAEAEFECRFQDADQESAAVRMVDGSVAEAESRGQRTDLLMLHRRPPMFPLQGTGDILEPTIYTTVYQCKSVIR